MNEIRIIPVEGIKEIEPGDNLGALIVEATAPTPLEPGDVVVVAQKVVSKAEGRFVDAADRRAISLAESARVLRRSGQMLISQTRHGFVCANAGVDASNVPGQRVLLLPIDPDLSARRIRSQIARDAGVDVGVVISDTFGRAWRLGQTNVAIGVAGIVPFIDYRGRTDAQGKPLSATRIAIADELAGAAEMVMGKSDGICAAIVCGAPVQAGLGAAVELVRPTSEDLFL